MPVQIHGKEYKTVAERINDLNEATKGDYSLNTEILSIDESIETYVVIKASLKIGENVYTGHAYEVFGSSNINKTSHVENCETSAVGRALAFAGYGGSEIASADEVANAISNKKGPSRARTPEAEDATTENTATHDADPTNKQKVFLKSIMNNALIEDDEAAKIAKWLEKDRTKDEYSTVIDRYKKIIDERIAAEETPY